VVNQSSVHLIEFVLNRKVSAFKSDTAHTLTVVGHFKIPNNEPSHPNIFKHIGAVVSDSFLLDVYDKS